MQNKNIEALEKPYNASDYEARLYTRWENSGYFNPDNLPNRHVTPFSIVLPPPNVTGTLHCGHATMLAIQDTIVRFKRMQGFKTLWLPGTDHAAIATQSKVEKEISKKEGKSRYDLGREELLRRIGIFAQESHDTIVNQCKSMGSSLDWSREAFTLDETRNKAVYKAFKDLYGLGLIDRGQRVINWDPKGQTTISDDEIVYEEREAILYTFKYSKDFPIAISTTRPETKFGDTAVAVHPDDERYAAFVGTTIETVFCGAPLSIKIIADRNVEKDFGTGALGVTPAHSKIDEEMARANDLPFIQVIDEKGKMTVGGEDIVGKKTAEVREIIAQKLRDTGLMIEEKKITQNVSTAERTGAVIEPLPKLQWFILVNKEFSFPHKNKTIAKEGELVTLKTLMHRAVESGATTILPDRFEKVYDHWITNLRDWCISRQIWYGHRIPVWYKGSEIYCGLTAPQGDDWKQDEDTLDTWFSSGTWSFSTLGWPDETSDLKTYHPNDLLETGRDIIFFWVARMILMSTCLLGEVPFKTVYLHGMALNKDGKKMSKSSGDTVDPLVVIDQYGTDALRMALIVGNAPGNDFKLYDDKIKAYKHFANKIWNASRFVLTNTKDAVLDEGLLNEKDAATLATWRTTLAEITEDTEKYNLYLAGEKLYSYFWHTFADVLIEEAKPRFQSADESDKKSVETLMSILLVEQLKALHPFMPYVTEAVWEVIHGDDKEKSPYDSIMADVLITFLQSFTPFQERIILALLGGLIPSIIWLFFWLREDDCKNQDTVAYICAPEPKPMLFLTFLTGMLMVPLALILERGIYPYVAGMILIIAWSSIEEILKLLGYWFVNAKSKFINEPSDPALYMLTVGLGFAAAENAFFLYQSLALGQTFDAALGGQILRFVGASLLHVGASGLIGICIGLAFFHGKLVRTFATIIGLFLGITIHVMFNYLVVFAEQTNILRVFGFVWVLAIGLIILFERVKELHPHQEV